jgi:hypothetical protein
MSILDVVRASGGTEVIIPTLELSSDAWADSLYVCAGFEDLAATLEDGTPVTFQACGMSVTLPKKSNDAAQVIRCAIDNVTGEAQQRVDAAKDAQSKITAVYRTYLSIDLTAPAERPIRMSVLNANISGATLNFDGGYFDLINTAWPRERYTSEFSPGVKYIT